MIDQLIFQASISTRGSARLAAVVLVSLPEQQFSQYLSSIYQIMLQSQEGKEEEIVKAVLVLGEIGTFKDLSGLNSIIANMSNLFKSESDQIRQAAAICLGSLCIGNNQFFLQRVFELIEKSEPQQKYMFLSTLREIIVSKPECLANYYGILIPLYLQQSCSSEE
mmetsp:Transcript_14247/g.24237  ORF Transcript_14247/g.24237 Transcript_14247/m.24237 type:complete len:165 (-) Transcript_14247:897-1391(-)